MTTKEEFYDQGFLQAKDNNTRCIEESILDNMPVGTIQVVDDSLFLSRSQKKRKAKKEKREWTSSQYNERNWFENRSTNG